MLKNILRTCSFALVCVSGVSMVRADVRLKLDATRDATAEPQAATFPAPTRTAKASTPAEDKTIESGIDLNDAGKFDAAIARYQEVLASNPDNMTALFELAFSQAANKDYQKSLETAKRGTGYKSDLLPMFYDIIGSTLDQMGQPQQAIDAYKRGVELVPSASMLYFNMAITYQESLKNNAEARSSLKKAARIDPTHPESQLILGQLFRSGGYNTPALLAFSRYLIIEPAGSRALQAYGLWRSILRGESDPALAAAGAPKTDEGDFAAVDAAIGSSHTAFAKEMNDGKPEIQALIRQLDAVLTRLTAREDKTTFAGVMYLPYFAELKRRNFIEPFAYWVSQRAPVPDVKEWIEANRDKVREFVTWSEKYQWPKP